MPHEHRGPGRDRGGDRGGPAFSNERRVIDLIVSLVAERVDEIVERRVEEIVARQLAGLRRGPDGNSGDR